MEIYGSEHEQRGYAIEPPFRAHGTNKVLHSSMILFFALEKFRILAGLRPSRGRLEEFLGTEPAGLDSEVAVEGLPNRRVQNLFFLDLERLRPQRWTPGSSDSPRGAALSFFVLRQFTAQEAPKREST